MNERISETELRACEDLAMGWLDSHEMERCITDDDFARCDAERKRVRKVFAEVRRLRGLIEPLANPFPGPPSRYNDLLAEARAIREEQGSGSG